MAHRFLVTNFGTHLAVCDSEHSVILTPSRDGRVQLGSRRAGAGNAPERLTVCCAIARQMDFFLRGGELRALRASELAQDAGVPSELVYELLEATIFAIGKGVFCLGDLLIEGHAHSRERAEPSAPSLADAGE